MGNKAETAAPFLLVGLLVLAWRGLASAEFTGEDLLLLKEQAGTPQLFGHVFRPLWKFWLWLEAQLFGGASPMPYFLSTGLLHGVNTASVFGIASALGASRLGSCLCALTFGVGAAVGDSLLWHAAVNRPLGNVPALLAIWQALRLRNGQSVRLWSIPALLLLNGLVVEEVLGTSCAVLAILVSHVLNLRGEPRPSSRSLPITLAACLLLLLAFTVTTVTHIGSAAESSGLWSSAEQFFRGGLERSTRIMNGWSPWPLAGTQALSGLVVLLALGSWCLPRGPRPWQSRALLLIWFFCSWAPFALQAGSPYRDYPTQAPLAICVGMCFDRAITLAQKGLGIPGQSPYPALVRLLALVLIGANGLRMTQEPADAWQQATADVRSARSLLKSKGPFDPATTAWLNLELGGRILLADSSIAGQPLDVFDIAEGYVSDPQVETILAGCTKLVGRMHTGDFDSVDVQQWKARAQLPSAWMVRRLQSADSIAAAQSAMYSAGVDLRAAAVVEANEGGPLWPEAVEPASCRWVQGPSVDRGSLTCTGSIEVQGQGPGLLLLELPFQRSALLRMGPEYARIARLDDPRLLKIQAHCQGQPLPTRHANVHGFLVLTPAGGGLIDISIVLRPAR